jgi:guanine deaminase
MRFSLRGTVHQTPSPGEHQVLHDTTIVVSNGVIESMGTGEAPDPDNHVELGSGHLLLPGLIDSHIHAPQWPQLGTGLDLPLEDWLFSHTFPLESSFADLRFAENVWEHMVPTLLSHGTTTAVYYSSIHEAATTALARQCAASGQRAFVGRVAMDHPNGTPEWYRDVSATESVAASHRSIIEIRDIDAGRSLIHPIVTPRFAPACSVAAMEGLAELAAVENAIIQTHCSESDWEHGYALNEFGMSDTAALDRFGLLQPHSILAHAGHTTADDWAVIADRGAAIAHCPLSNSYFGDAVLPVRRAMAAGVTIGLGTDVAGGAEPGLLPQCQHAVTSSRMLEDGVDPAVTRIHRRTEDQRIDTVAAFWMATMGGAQAVGQPIGLLEPGRRFDALAVSVDRPSSPLRRWDDVDDDARIFEKVVRLARPADIAHVWVDGVRVAGAA